MTDEQTALARRAVACTGWRWIRGMLRQDDYRYIGSGVWARWSDVHSTTTALHMPVQWPDLTDPATLGCLLALVREAWGTAIIVSYSYDEGLWETMWEGATAAGWCGRGASEAEALVAALESAT